MPESETETTERIREHFKETNDATESEYRDMLDDLQFANGEQWPQAVKQQRDADGRPCLVINKIPSFVDRISGDQRQARPAITVRPVDSNADPDTALVLSGIIKNIEVQSNATIAYDTAFDSCAVCGYGVFRIVTQYCDDESFDQEIRISRIKNPFTVYFDPFAQKWDKSDGRYGFVTEKIARAQYTKSYPKADPCNFESDRDELRDWIEPDAIRIAEYFEKNPVKKRLYLISIEDQQLPLIVEELPDKSIINYEVLNERDVESHEIKHFRTNGKELLEEPTVWPGRYIPLVGLWGKELNIENQSIHRGIVRTAKDAMRLYNYNRSMGAEHLALAPKAPWLVTPTMIGAFKQQWDTADKRNWPYLFFEPDDKVGGGAPQRTFPQPASQAIVQEIMMSDQELHDTTGLQLASLGKRSNEQSGRAIIARAQEGDIGQYPLMENLSRSLVYAGKVIVDLIPKIYDTERIVRIIGQDDKEESVKINGPFFDEKTGTERLHDVRLGKYDVTVSTGPSYQTQRQEAVDTMMSFIQYFPQSASIISDMLVKNMDWPGAEEVAKRLKKLVPPEVLDERPPGQAQQQGPPPEVQAQMKIDMETKAVQLEQEKVELAQKQIDLQKKELERQKLAQELGQKGEKGAIERDKLLMQIEKEMIE